MDIPSCTLARSPKLFKRCLLFSFFFFFFCFLILRFRFFLNERFSRSSVSWLSRWNWRMPVNSANVPDNRSFKTHGSVKRAQDGHSRVKQGTQRQFSKTIRESSAEQRETKRPVISFDPSAVWNSDPLAANEKREDKRTQEMQSGG